VPLSRGEPLARLPGVESVTLLVLGLRKGARCARRLARASRPGHSLLSVLPPKKLREPIAGPPRGGELAQLCRKLLRWRYLSLSVHSLCTRDALDGARATLRVVSWRFCQDVSRL
jgi:hypothetical protein